MSVYNLAPETLDTFDMVYCGDLLIHLRDPNLALQRIRSVTREYALFAECVQPLLAMFPLEVNQYMGGREDCVWWWFKPSTLGLMMLDAGFRNVEPLSFFKLDYPDGRPGPWRAVFRAWV
jgi:SAM-dependent methyltransferase